MFSTAHLTSGIALGLALGLDGAPLAALVLASVFTDWDYAFQLLTGRNHRTFVTHSPVLYVALLGPLGFLEPLAWWVLLGSLLHFSLDVWEYGIRLNPFSRRIYGLRLLPGVEAMRFADYLRTYFGDRRFLGAEVGFALAAAALAAWRLL
ncbi:MAG TPA: metal-dependent hydrolase [Candidatus Thermoplasmatota archaeon]|nr:metal-dependent hydrolase [Candidatus Thermoplasmatota archaeon]